MYLKLLKESEEMTKEEAIQILSTRDAHGVLCGYTSGVTEALDMAIEALKEQEISNELQEYAYECGYEHFFHECQSCEHRKIGNKAQDWIPCSERLPENDGGMYLVTDYCEQINRRRIHISYCYVNREGFWSDIPIGYKVIAWMPLPKPYREEGE